MLDREFSYLGLLLNQVEEGIHYVIHLNLRSYQVKIYNQDGQEVALIISAGETVILNGV